MASSRARFVRCVVFWGLPDLLKREPVAEGAREALRRMGGALMPLVESRELRHGA